MCYNGERNDSWWYVVSMATCLNKNFSRKQKMIVSCGKQKINSCCYIKQTTAEAVHFVWEHERSIKSVQIIFSLGTKISVEKQRRKNKKVVYKRKTNRTKDNR